MGYSGADESTVSTLTLAAGNESLSGLLLFTRREGSETENSGSVGGTGPARERPDPQSIDSNNIVAKLAYKPAEGHEFTLGFDYFDNDTDTRIFSDYGIVSRGTTIDRRDAEDERTRTRWSLAYRYAGNLGIADSLQATVYQQSSESTQLTAEARTSPAGEQQKRHRLSSFDQDIEGVFVSSQSHWSLPALSTSSVMAGITTRPTARGCATVAQWTQAVHRSPSFFRSRPAISRPPKSSSSGFSCRTKSCFWTAAGCSRRVFGSTA